MRGPRRLLAPLAVGAFQVGMVFAVLGLPRLPAAADFLVSTSPTVASGLAAAQVLVWLLTLAGATLALVVGLAEARRAIRRIGQARLWASAVMVTGLLTLAGGYLHFAQAHQVRMSGGSIQEVRELAK